MAVISSLISITIQWSWLASLDSEIDQFFILSSMSVSMSGLGLAQTLDSIWISSFLSQRLHQLLKFHSLILKSTTYLSRGEEFQIKGLFLALPCIILILLVTS